MSCLCCLRSVFGGVFVLRLSLSIVFCCYVRALLFNVFGTCLLVPAIVRVCCLFVPYCCVFVVFVLLCLISLCALLGIIAL